MTRPEAMSLAMDMYGDWSASEIVRYLAEHGVTVSETTVKRWGNPEAAEAKRLQDVERARQRRRDTRVFSRILELRGRGMSLSGIAVVLSVDHGCEVNGEQVRWCVTSGRMSRELSRVLFDEFVPGALRVAGPVVESRPESTRGELQVGGYDARLPTPTPFGDVS